MLHLASPGIELGPRHASAAAGIAPPVRLLSARTLDEVHERLETVLRALYPDDARFHFYVADERGGLVRVGRPDACAPAAAPLRLVQTASTIGAPLVDDLAATIGAVVVEGPPGAAAFTRLHAEVLEGIAALVSVAVQRLRPAPRDRRALDRSAARELQRRLMTDRLPAGIGVTACAEYLPAFEVGGDFYGLRHLDDGSVAALIGDVSGNGVSAALLMSRVAADLERALAAGETPAAALGGVNERLHDPEGERFVTACCLRIAGDRRSATVANAGHLPIVIRRAHGEVLACSGASGLPLGIAPGTYASDAVPLEAGDVLLLVTDGVLEALDHPSGRMGLELLMSLVRDGPHDVHALHARLGAAIADAAAAAALDDVTWVALQVEG